MIYKDMRDLLEKVRLCWRISTELSLATLLDNLKMLSDNPYRDLWDSTNIDLIVGADRYLTQIKRDHPEKFDVADREEAEENDKLNNVKRFRDMNDEEKLAFKRETIAKARKVRMMNYNSRREQGTS